MWYLIFRGNALAAILIKPPVGASHVRLKDRSGLVWGEVEGCGRVDSGWVESDPWGQNLRGKYRTWAL